MHAATANADLAAAIQSLIAADRSHRVKVVVVGDVMIDEYVDGEIERVSPEAPVPVIRTHGLPDAYPGGAANVAHQFRHWNVDVSLIGFADIPTLATLEREGLPIGGLVPAGKTPIKRRFCAGGQMVLRQDIEKRNYGIDANMLESARGRLLSRLGELTYVAAYMQPVDIAIFSDYDKGVFDKRTIRLAMEICTTRGIPVVVDHKRRPIQEWAGAFAIKMNESEFPCGELPENSIVTYGGHGYSLRSGNGRGKICGRVPVPHANAIGSGDCHVAHLALALAHGRGMEFAAEFAYQAGRAYVRGDRNRPNLPHEVLREVDAAAAKCVGNAKQLASVLRARHAACTTVFTNGVFDLLHPGHLHTLRWARAQGDLLIVGLNSDESVRRLGKGDGRPFLDESKRAAMLAALDCVDYVVLYDRASAGDVLEVLRVDKMVKGSDYNLADVLHQDLVGETLIAPPSGFAWHSSDFLSAVAA